MKLNILKHFIRIQRNLGPLNLNIGVCVAKGIHGDVGWHDNAALPWLHEQRSDWSDSVTYPDAATTLPDDWIHTFNNRCPGREPGQMYPLGEGQISDIGK